MPDRIQLRRTKGWPLWYRVVIGVLVLMAAVVWIALGLLAVHIIELSQQARP